MTVAIDDLLSVVGDVHHVDRGVGGMEALHERGVLVARLIVAEDADVLQAGQLQVGEDGSRARGLFRSMGGLSARHLNLSKTGPWRS